MNLPKIHSLFNIFLILALLTVLSGCQNLLSNSLPSNNVSYDNTSLDQTSSKETLKEIQRQENRIYLLGIEQAISKGRWLINEYKFQLALQESEERTFLTPFNIRHYQFEQKVLSTRLIEYAQEALAKGDTNNASRCYQVLRKLQTPESIKPSLTDIAKKLFQKKEKSLVKKQTKLGKKLDKSIQEGQLIESSQLITQLQQLKLLSKEVIVKIDKAKGVLTHSAELLDEKADIFYRDGNIQLAKSLWEYLLKFDPENQSIKNKLARSDRVIKNMPDLRDKASQPYLNTSVESSSDGASNESLNKAINTPLAKPISKSTAKPSSIKNNAQRRMLNR